MLVFDGVGGLVFLAVWIFCFIDVLTTPETACRSLPKLAWVFVVLLLPLIGSIGWLVAGHPWDRTRLPATQLAARTAATRRPANPDDDEEFLAGLRLQAEEQRRRAREQAERDARDAPDGEPG